MKSYILSIVFLSLSIACKAQYYTPVSWESTPKIHEVPKQFAGESAVFVLDRRHIQYKSEDKQVVVYRTVHRIVKVQDDKGLETFNKMSIAFAASRSIEKIQARTILPNGKVLEVGKDKITLTKTEDGLQAYVFAFEGIEKGAEVEYLFTEKRELAMFGTEQLQYSIPTMRADFTLVTPEHFHFDLKGYNGFPGAVDTVLDLKRFYNITALDIPSLEEEQYSLYDASLMKVDYRLSYVDNEDGKVRLNTWNDLAMQLYSNYYTYSDKEKRVVDKYLKSINVSSNDSEEQKIRKIEDALKTGINMIDAIPDESYLNFDNIVDKKLTSESGFIRFFVACLQMAGVQHEFGLTTNRYQAPLDEQFENWKLLEVYVIYIPGLKQYLAPSSIFHRMPFLPIGVVENKAVFCKLTTLGDMTTAVASIRKIPALSYENSNHNLEAAVNFDKDMNVSIDLTTTFKGYSAMGVREALIYTPKDKEKELVQNLISIAPKPEDLSSYSVENAAFNNYYDNRALTIVSKVNTPQLVEKAGPKYLFKVGDVIGRQVEMYQDKERKLPIDINYPHAFQRKIIINIPNGYRVANPEVVNMLVDHKLPDGNQTMGFISGYKLEGNKMIISIDEFYRQVNYPVSEIEPFRKVINAAADFNKTVLVMEKI